MTVDDVQATRRARETSRSAGWRGRRGARAALALLLAGLAPAVAGAQTTGPAPILPDALRWFSPPGNPSLRGAWMLGGDGQPGPYVLRVAIAAGGRIPPHTHPDTRHTTVLSGSVLVGFGETFDESAMVAVPAGAVYVAPAGVAHYLWARDGDAVYQESGNGPTATAFVAR